MRTIEAIDREIAARQCHVRVRELPVWAGSDNDPARVRWEAIAACTRIHEVWCDGFMQGMVPVVLNPGDMSTTGLAELDTVFRRLLKVTDEEIAMLSERDKALDRVSGEGEQ